MSNQPQNTQPNLSETEAQLGAPTEEPASGDGETPKVAQAVTVNVYDNGMIDISNGSDEELDPRQLENLFRTVYEDVQRQNLMQDVMEQFKQRLG